MVNWGSVLGKTDSQYEEFKKQRFQQTKGVPMFNIYFSENNEGKSKIKMECYEVRESIDSAIKFIVTLWPEENPVQQVAMITNAETNTVVATIMRGPNGECVVTIPDLPTPTVRVYSVIYDTVTCPKCFGKKRRTADPCDNCHDKGTKLICRAVEEQTAIKLPPSVTKEHPIYEDD